MRKTVGWVHVRKRVVRKADPTGCPRDERVREMARLVGYISQLRRVMRDTRPAAVAFLSAEAEVARAEQRVLLLRQSLERE